MGTASKPKIIVTGANGQLGKEIRLLAPSFPEYEFLFLSREDLPIHHYPLVKQYFHSVKPAFCINCAAYTQVDKAEEEQELAFQINGEAVGVLAGACREYGTRFIHISTDYVFDGKAETPYTPESPTQPQSVYGASKRKGEELAMQNNPDSIIIRTSWVYSRFGKNFVKTMMRLLQEKESISVVNDQVGSPTYAADLAEAILIVVKKCSESPAACVPGIFHFSNAGVISWYEFAVAIRDEIGSSCIVHPIPTSSYPTPARRPAYSVLDKRSFCEAYGIQLKPWKESLSKVISVLSV